MDPDWECAPIQGRYPPRGSAAHASEHKGAGCYSLGRFVSGLILYTVYRKRDRGGCRC